VGISGSGRHLLPAIPPGKSFVARFTPPRAGTFIYHTHMDDVNQLSSGLYGPLIVLPPGERFDPESDRVLVISKAGTGQKPIWLNGSQSPEISRFKVGHTYRLRIINISPENPPIDVSLKIAGRAATWRPIAKDGADLPTGQRELRPAQATVSVGEVYDFEFRPEQPGLLALELVRPAILFPAQVTPSHKVVEGRSENRIAVNVAVQE
jgi:FtsP/CotA-like multicopper oxidase with cupredoxin domain